MESDSKQNIVAPWEGPQQEEGVGDNPFEPFVGSLPAFSTRDDINAWIRDLRNDDPNLNRNEPVALRSASSD